MTIAQRLVRTCGPLLFLLFVLANTAAGQTWGFDDGTAQGWSPGDPYGTGFAGTLEVIGAGGNPGPYLRASDTSAASGILAVLAPAIVSGDLSTFFMTWEELLPSSASISTYVYLEGIDGTLYRSDFAITSTTGVWSPREVRFGLESEWILTQGSSSYHSVVTDVAALYVVLEVVTGVGTEAGMDNIVLMENPVPVEATSWSQVKAAY